MNKRAKLSEHPLSYNECGLIAAKVNSLSLTLGAPGDWGYGTKLGDLAIILESIHKDLITTLAESSP